MTEHQKLREIRALDYLNACSCENFSDPKYLHGYVIQLEETATAAIIQVKQKDHGYSADQKLDRWRFNLAQTVCRNWQAKIHSKVHKIPRKTSKLGIEI